MSYPGPATGNHSAPVLPSGPAAPALPRALRALRHRNFRLFFLGQGISVIGTWMTRLATSWLVYRLTHSAFLLGVVGFTGLILTFLLAPFAGVWIERMDRRRLLVGTQAVAAAQSLVLAALTLSRFINIHEVIALSLVGGLVNAFDMPARQAFLVKMVEDRSDLSNAIALNSSMVNGARLVGPALAGLVIAGLGEGWCFLIDGISYFAVIASLLMMRVAAVTPTPSPLNMLAQLREGWIYVTGFRPVRDVLLLFSMTSLMAYPYMTLLPVFAGQVLHGGPHTLGFLSGAAGVGSLVSAVLLTLRKSVVGLTRSLATAAALLGIALVLFGLSHTLSISLLLMLFIGYGMIQGLSGSNTVIRTLVPEHMRARVMGYYTVAFVGTAPFGSLFAGILAQHIGAPHTVVLSGICCIAAALWFSTELPHLRRIIRPIYESMGLLPAVEQTHPLVPSTPESPPAV